MPPHHCTLPECSAILGNLHLLLLKWLLKCNLECAACSFADWFTRCWFVTHVFASVNLWLIAIIPTRCLYVVQGTLSMLCPLISCCYKGHTDRLYHSSSRSCPLRDISSSLRHGLSNTHLCYREWSFYTSQEKAGSFQCLTIGAQEKIVHHCANFDLRQWTYSASELLRTP